MYLIASFRSIYRCFVERRKGRDLLHSSKRQHTQSHWCAKGLARTHTHTHLDSLHHHHHHHLLFTTTIHNLHSFSLLSKGNIFPLNICHCATCLSNQKERASFFGFSCLCWIGFWPAIPTTRHQLNIIPMCGHTHTPSHPTERPKTIVKSSAKLQNA